MIQLKAIKFNSSPNSTNNQICGQKIIIVNSRDNSKPFFGPILKITNFKAVEEL